MSLLRPRISIIIPVYNTPILYFRRCIDSIIEQTLKDLEVLVIDDGSASNYAKYYDQIGELYESVYVIHQKNTGVSAARNKGLQIAHGEYCMFVDADDELALKTCLEESYNLASSTNADIVIGRVIYKYKNKQFTSDFFDEKYRLYSGESEIEDFAAYFFNYYSRLDSGIPSNISRGLHAKLFRRQSIEEIRFDEKMAYAEDGMFCADACSNASRVALANSEWYLYYQYKKSAAHSKGTSECKAHCESATRHINKNNKKMSMMAFSMHCILDTCLTLLQTKGMRSFSQVKGLLHQDWVLKTLQSFDEIQFSIPKWQKLFLFSVRNMNYKSAVGLLYVGTKYLKISGKILIG